MPESPQAGLRDRLSKLDPSDASYASEFVDCLFELAVAAGASDLHLLPTDEALDVRWRIDGVLTAVGVFPRSIAANVAGRLKVLADLLTYRTDIPQEGRIRSPKAGVEMRLSTLPTLYGEKAVIRLFITGGRYLRLAELGLPADITSEVARLLGETGGAFLITGPAGSGKTTTAYACLREILERSAGGRSVVTLEDPIEQVIAGAAQSQVNQEGEFSMAAGLKFLMRQDPEVILLGEIRDPSTAETAFQAALTGHLVISTFHTGSAAGALSRLADMGIAPYLLRSGLLGILSQRLVRRLCDCAVTDNRDDAHLGLAVTTARRPVGCPACQETGYRGRLVLAEMLRVEQSDLGRAILSRGDSARLEALAIEGGMISRWQRAIQAIEAGLTSPAEVRRTLGFSDNSGGGLL